MPKNYENARQLVTDYHRFKVGDKLSPSLQKKEALSGFSITFFHSILQQYSFLAQRLNFTCHIMTNEEDSAALAYCGTGWRESS